MRRLILRPGAIGDCILALPAVEHLVSEYTEIWTASAVVPLIRFASRVRALSSTGIDVVGIGNSMDRELERVLQSFDLIVSWYGANRPEFRDALLATGVSCQFLPALPPPDYGGHASAFFCAQVGAPEAVPRIDVDRADGAGRPDQSTIALHPFSGSARKNWPLARYRELAASLDRKVEWLAGPEEDLAEARRFGDLCELARWLRGTSLYIGNDSGITHLAAAVGVPTLALFGPTDPIRWGPRGDNVTVLRHQPIEDLSVDEVRRAANRRLG